jgi:hypothetical protein
MDVAMVFEERHLDPGARGLAKACTFCTGDVKGLVAWLVETLIG